eukprot:101905_1
MSHNTESKHVPGMKIAELQSESSSNSAHRISRAKSNRSPSPQRVKQTVESECFPTTSQLTPTQPPENFEQISAQKTNFGDRFPTRESSILSVDRSESALSCKGILVPSTSKLSLLSEQCISGTPLAASTSIIAETSGIAPTEIPVDVPSDIPVDTCKFSPDIPVDACQYSPEILTVDAYKSSPEIQVDVPSEIPANVYQPNPEIPVDSCKFFPEIPVDVCQPQSEVPFDTCQSATEIPVEVCQSSTEVPVEICQSSTEIPVEICKSPHRSAVCKDNYANPIHSPVADRWNPPVSTPSPPGRLSAPPPPSASKRPVPRTPSVASTKITANGSEQKIAAHPAKTEFSESKLNLDSVLSQTEEQPVSPLKVEPCRGDFERSILGHDVRRASVKTEGYPGSSISVQRDDIMEDLYVDVVSELQNESHPTFEQIVSSQPDLIPAQPRAPREVIVIEDSPTSKPMLPCGSADSIENHSKLSDSTQDMAKLMLSEASTVGKSGDHDTNFHETCVNSTALLLDTKPYHQNPNDSQPEVIFVEDSTDCRSNQPVQSTQSSAVHFLIPETQPQFEYNPRSPPKVALPKKRSRVEFESDAELSQLSGFFSQDPHSKLDSMYLGSSVSREYPQFEEILTERSRSNLENAGSVVSQNPESRKENLEPGPANFAHFLGTNGASDIREKDPTNQQLQGDFRISPENVITSALPIPTSQQSGLPPKVPRKKRKIDHSRLPARSRKKFPVVTTRPPPDCVRAIHSDSGRDIQADSGRAMTTSSARLGRVDTCAMPVRVTRSRTGSDSKLCELISPRRKSRTPPGVHHSQSHVEQPVGRIPVLTGPASLLAVLSSLNRNPAPEASISGSPTGQVARSSRDSDSNTSGRISPKPKLKFKKKIRKPARQRRKIPKNMSDKSTTPKVPPCNSSKSRRKSIAGTSKSTVRKSSRLLDNSVISVSSDKPPAVRKSARLLEKSIPSDISAHQEAILMQRKRSRSHSITRSQSRDMGYSPNSISDTFPEMPLNFEAAAPNATPNSSMSPPRSQVSIDDELSGSDVQHPGGTGSKQRVFVPRKTPRGRMSGQGKKQRSKLKPARSRLKRQVCSTGGNIAAPCVSSSRREIQPDPQSVSGGGQLSHTSPTCKADDKHQSEKPVSTLNCSQRNDDKPKSCYRLRKYRPENRGECTSDCLSSCAGLSSDGSTSGSDGPDSPPLASYLPKSDSDVPARALDMQSSVRDVPTSAHDVQASCSDGPDSPPLASLPLDFSVAFKHLDDLPPASPAVNSAFRKKEFFPRKVPKVTKRKREVLPSTSAEKSDSESDYDSVSSGQSESESEYCESPEKPVKRRKSRRLSKVRVLPVTPRRSDRISQPVHMYHDGEKNSDCDLSDKVKMLKDIFPERSLEECRYVLVDSNYCVNESIERLTAISCFG